MSRTLGIRVGNPNIIQDTRDNLIKMKKMDMSLSQEDQNITAMKSFAQFFVTKSLQMSKENWINTDIESIWQETKRDNIVINIRFKSKNDIAKINSHKKHLTNNAKNNVYQYVSGPLLSRYIAWETAGYKI